MPILCGLITSAADSLMTIRTHISSLEHASNSHMQMMCFCYRASTAVGNFNWTENVFKFTEISLHKWKESHTQKKDKIEISKVNEVDPNSNQKNRICPFYLLLFLLIIFPSSSSSSTTCYTIFSLVTKQRNAIQCDGDHLICELFMFDFKSSPQVLSFIDVKVV